MQAIDGSIYYLNYQSAVLDPSIACAYCVLACTTKYQNLLGGHALMGTPDPFDTLLPNP